MAAIAPELQTALYKAHAYAKAQRQGQVTLEHIALFLLDTKTVKKAFKACFVDLPRLKDELAALAQELPEPAEPGQGEPKATTGYQRCMRRAALHAAATGSGEVLGINLLITLYTDKEAGQVVNCLSDCGAHRQTIVDYHSTGRYVSGYDQ